MDKVARYRIHLARFIALFFVICLSLLPLLLNTKSAIVFSAQKEYDLNVHFIDVGQGDCIFIELPDKKTMLIDAGPTSASGKVVSYISSLNVETIDYLVLTHSDEDHSGGMTAVLQNFEVKHIFRPFIAATNTDILTEDDELSLYYTENEICLVNTVAYANFIKYAYQEVYFENETEYQSMITVSYDGYVILSSDDEVPYIIEFHNPPKVGEIQIPSSRIQGYPTKFYSSDTNSYSPIISLMYENEKFLFTGDATSTSEKDFLKNLPEPGQSGYERSEAVKDVSLLKVAHHGSNSSSSSDFLSLVNPSYAVIMCGLNNTYNQPHPNVIEGLNLLWSDHEEITRILRSDLNGDIVASTNGDEIKFLLEKTPNLTTDDSKTIPDWIIYVIIAIIILVLIASIIVRIYKIKQEKAKIEGKKTKNTKKEIKKRVKKAIIKTKPRKK